MRHARIVTQIVHARAPIERSALFVLRYAKRTLA
jgi:hypothetical protein